MITKIIQFSIKNRLLIIIIALITLVYSTHVMRQIPFDALPDLSENQVIIYIKWDKSPDIIEAQVTYPIITSLLGAPKVKSIRGISDFGNSFIYVIFQDSVDLYWARSRVLEYLSKISASLPKDVKIELGPDGTGVGWIYQYALVDTKAKLTLAELRSIQDFKLKFLLSSVSGVAEVASIGGYQKEYQIHVDPQKLYNYNLPLTTVIEKVLQSNEETGARLVEIARFEYMIRSQGYLKSIEDIKQISLGVDKNGIPVLLQNIATVTLGPQIRRGVTDLDGLGDTVSGIVVMRHKENALNVISKVKQKLKEFEKTLPDGVKIIPVYDRSELITHSIENLQEKVMEEIIIVSLVILLFLWHFPSAIVPILTIPLSVIFAFFPLYYLDIGANVMSISGIAISIGVLVDGAIVEVENAYKKIETWIANGKQGDIYEIRSLALLEVGPSVFFSLLIIAVSFFPIFALEEMEGKLFKPLAYSKNLTMLVASVLAITLDPAIRMLFTRVEPFTFSNSIVNKFANFLFVGNYYPEENHPISKRLISIYEPICFYVMRHYKRILAAAFLLILLSFGLYFKMGQEFMPAYYEETLLYMPTTMPGISITEAGELLKKMDEKLKSIPEIEKVFGKAGRAETATDPSPLSMIETIILLKPESTWRKKQTFYSHYPEFIKPFFRLFLSDRLTYEDLIEILNYELQIPGVSNAWTMPIKNRIDMLSTGLRTPLGIKVQGDDSKTIEEISLQIEKLLKDFSEVQSVFAERSQGGYYLDLKIKRYSLARYGLTVQDVQKVITTTIGGESLTTIVEGRERYSLSLRYPREFRNTKEQIGKVLVPSGNKYIPLREVVDIEYNYGPSMLRNENGFLTGYIYITLRDEDLNLLEFLEKAKETIDLHVTFPKGYFITWAGQFESMKRVREKMKFLLPLTLGLIFILIYLNTKSYFKTLVILLAVPFSLVGAFLLLFALGYKISVAVWVGLIALMGLDAETGMFMLLYLDLSIKEAQTKQQFSSDLEIQTAIVNGAVKRIRPKLMTVLSAFLGLLPIAFSTGTGSDLMKTIALPMVGGLFTSFLLELCVYPAIYYAKYRNVV